MNLNSDQRRAVGAEPTAAINVVAGAGTGKTTVLVERYLKLIREDGIAPDRLLALTFTLKAAAEMRERVHAEVAAAMAGRTHEFHDAWILNFHQFGLRIIKSNAPAFGIDPDVGVMSPADFHRVRGILKRRFVEGRIEGVPRDFGGEPPAPAKLESRFELFLRAALDCRSKLVDLDTLRARCTADDLDGYVAYVEAIIAVGRAYERELGRRNLIDFGDMIALPARALDSNRALHDRYVSRFEHILVDEFQDTSEAQNELLKILCGGRFERVTVVGDAKQSIYRWRDARVENIVNFDGERFPLKANYRSRQNILDVANVFIANEQNVTLRAERGAADRPVTLFHPRDGFSREEEARALASWVLWLTEGQQIAGMPAPPDRSLDYDDVTILLRKLRHNGGLPEIEREFALRQIPYAVVGGANAAETWALEGFHALLSLLLPGDRVRELLTVLERDPYNVPDESLDALFVNVKSKPIGHDWLADEELARVGGGVRPRIVQLRELLVGMRERMMAMDFRRFIAWSLTESSLLRRLFDSGLTWRAVDDLLGEVLEIVDSIEERGEMHLGAFLDSLRAAIDEKKFREEGDVRLPAARVRIMTIHQSKGLEFPAVAVAGITPPPSGDDKFFISRDKGIFFRSKDKKHWHRSFDDVGPEIDRELEMEKQEERCVLYVAMTRARDYLWISSPCAEGLKKVGNRKEPVASLFCDVLSVVRDTAVDVVELRDAPALEGVRAAPATHVDTECEDDVTEVLRARNEARERYEASLSVRSAEPIEFVNWSALAAYAACPLQYAYRHRSSLSELWFEPPDGAGTPDEIVERFGDVEIPAGMAPAEYGAIVHESLEEAMKSPGSGVADDERIAAIVGRVGLAGQEADLVRDAVAGLVASVRESELGTAGDEMRLEEPFEVRLDRVVFHGVFDRVERDGSRWWVTDYKVGQREPSHRHQAAAYAWALGRITGSVASGRICYVRHGGVKVEPVTDTDYDVEATLRSLEGSLDSGLFAARPGEICDRCAFNALCPSAAATVRQE